MHESPPLPYQTQDPSPNLSGSELQITASRSKPSEEGLIRKIWRRGWSCVDWLMGFVALVCGLAIFSVIPILNFLSLGYLLEVSGRVARTGKFRAGFVGIRKASSIGSLVVGTWLILLPVRFVSGMWKDAELISAGSQVAQAWKLGLIFLSVLAALHISWAAIRGGRLRHFLWPAPIQFFRWLGQEGKFTQVRNGVFSYIKAVRIPYYFWLGFRGFVGALMWLAIPVLVLIGASHIGNEIVSFFVNLIGGGLLLIVAMYLPFVQANFARTGSFDRFLDLQEVRALFRRAPFAFWFALLTMVLFALPLYLLKIELPPQDLAWIPSLIFVVFIIPARLMIGWAFARSLKRVEPRHWILTWGNRLGSIPVVAAYVFVVWLTQYLSFHGTWSLLEQHAFLVPAPMLGL